MPRSAVDCVQPAIQHTREQLFRPFRFGQWSRLALVGILAAELHSGGCSFGNFPVNFPKPSHRPDNEFLSRVPPGFPIDPSQISHHFGQFLGLILIGIFALIVIGFVFLYINSVFRFILFESVVQRTCSIGDGWHKWRRAGGRFFLWQLVFQISAGIFLLVLIGVPLALAAAAGWMNDFSSHIGRAVVGIVLLVGLVIIAALVMAVVQVLAKDFLVPVMALENLDFADGWHRLLEVMGPEKGNFVVYLLLKLALLIAAAVIFGIVTIIPIIIVVVPAVVAVIAGAAMGVGWNVTTISLAIIFGTMLFVVLMYVVALLCVPATVFFPAYSLHFLAARYPALDALLHPAPPPAPQAPPEIAPPMEPPPEPPPLPPSPEPV